MANFELKCRSNEFTAVPKTRCGFNGRQVDDGGQEPHAPTCPIVQFLIRHVYTGGCCGTASTKLRQDPAWPAWNLGLTAGIYQTFRSWGNAQTSALVAHFRVSRHSIHKSRIGSHDLSRNWARPQLLTGVEFFEDRKKILFNVLKMEVFLIQ